MSSSRDSTPLRLYDMVAFGLDAIRLAQGRSRADLDSDLALRYALVHLIQTIGEAASKVSPAFKGQHPDIPWSDIVAMRHLIVHEYWRLDLNVVWDVPRQELPELI